MYELLSLTCYPTVRCCLPAPHTLPQTAQKKAANALPVWSTGERRAYNGEPRQASVIAHLFAKSSRAPSLLPSLFITSAATQVAGALSNSLPFQHNPHSHAPDAASPPLPPFLLSSHCCLPRGSMEIPICAAPGWPFGFLGHCKWSGQTVSLVRPTSLERPLMLVCVRLSIDDGVLQRWGE
jgi:hypothetical protein